MFKRISGIYNSIIKDDYGDKNRVMGGISNEYPDASSGGTDLHGDEKNL